MRRLVLMRRHFSTIGLTGLVLVAGIVLAACGGGQNGAPATVTGTAAEGSQPPPASVDPPTGAVESDSADEAGLTTTQLDPASAKTAMESVISCLNGEGFSAKELSSETVPTLSVTASSTNLGFVSIVSSDYYPEDVVDAASGSAAAIYEEPNGVYVEGWTTKAPGTAVASALDRCYEEAGLPSVDRGGLVSVEDTPSTQDEFADTRISGQLANEISRSIRTSWNRCDAKDVCIPGEYAYSVGCKQPDPQVRKLSCFVTTEKRGDGSAYGYTVIADVGETSYSWGLD